MLEGKKNREIAKYKEKYTPDEIKTAEKTIRKFLGTVASSVYREYLPQIARNYNVRKLLTDDRKTENCVAYIELKKFVVDEETSIVDCLKTVYHVLAYSSSSLALIIQRKRDECVIGIAVGNSDNSPEKTYKTMAQLRDALIGNFPGTEIKDFELGSEKKTGIKHHSKGQNSLLSNLNTNYVKSIASVSNVATELTDDFSVQGIEKLLDGIRPLNDNSEYTLILLGESVGTEALIAKKNGLFETYSALSPHATRQKNWSIGEAKEWSTNWNAAIGGHENGKKPVNVPFIDTKANIGLDEHFGFGHSWGGSINANESSSVDIIDFKVKHTLEMLEKQLKRLEESEALGLWNFAAYVMSPDLAVTNEVAHMYMSLTQGKESFYEKPAINTWDVFRTNEAEAMEQEEQINKILQYLNYLIHPEFEIKNNIVDKGYYPVKVSATTTLSGEEFARALNLPGKSVPGFAVIKCASFGREISSYDEIDDASINLGAIHHMHQNENMMVNLSKKSITSHVFVTGSTGTGKSNTIYNMLNELSYKPDNKVPFLVIEPTKGEYRYAFGKNVSVYGTRPNVGNMLKLNPFEFPEEIHVFGHIDRILEVFNVCWPMYAAMPAVLKDAVIQAYEKCGWDLKNSINKKGRIYPTFEDVLQRIDYIMDISKYSDENKGNYKGALSTRLQSLTNGLNGMIFCEGNIADTLLFDQNVIIDLSKIGSCETKALIMGVLIIKLQEYRMSQGGINLELKHVTVLEEAHNILKNTNVQGSGESSNIAAKSVEMISNSIAEMRTYGEGFIIVDQAPGLMDMSVIRNTNTKIIMRLPDQSDRELVGKSASLNEKQIEELARLQRGVAAVYQNEWVEPVLCKIKKAVTSIDEKKIDKNIINNDDAKSYVAMCVLNPKYLLKHADKFIENVESISLSGQVKAQLIDYYRTPYPKQQEIWQRTVNLFFADVIKDITVKVRESKEIDSGDLKNMILEEIWDRYGLEKNDVLDRKTEYLFVQTFIYESIRELNRHLETDEVELCKRLEHHMMDLGEVHKFETNK